MNTLTSDYRAATPLTHDTPSAVASLDRLAPLAWPMVRIVTGLLLIPHGAQKLFGWFGGHGLAGTGAFFETALGMSPGLLWAGLAGAVEFFGGLALVLGLLTRPAAAAVAVLLAVAHDHHQFSRSTRRSAREDAQGLSGAGA